MGKIPLLIDTDAGTDDALALIMALKHSDYEVVSITTVAGNVPLEKVVQNVLYLVEQCERTTPVYIGAGQPLKRHLHPADFIHGVDGLGDIDLDLSGRMPSGDDAPNEIIRMAEMYKGELIIITLGPMTNLAMAYHLDPDLGEKIKHCYVMGGVAEHPGNITPLSEFNFWADPEAAQISLHAGIDMTLIGWGVTVAGGFLTQKELHELKQIDTHLARISVDMQNVKLKWLMDQGQEPICYLADPLAMSVLLNPEVIIRSKHYYSKVLESEDACDTRGQLIISSTEHNNPTPNLHIIREIDHETFKQTLFDAYITEDHG